MNLEEQQILSALLHYRCGYPQIRIANLMNVSQSTMSTWIKFGKLLIENRNLSDRVDYLMKELKKQGIKELPPLRELKDDILEIIE